VETPAIEYTDALGKFLPDQDRPNEGVFSFQDDDEQWLSLRYDLTAPLARYVAENYQHLALPYRSYRVGYVYRNEKPGPGRFRQFMQFDADTVGTPTMAADAEMCMLAADTMEALGIPRGSYVVKVWSRKLLEGVLDAAHVIDGQQRLTALRAIDKLDRLGMRGVQQLLGAGRKDESGDFTKGVGLPNSANNFITTSSSTASSPTIFSSYSSEELLAPTTIDTIEKSEKPPFSFHDYTKKLTTYLGDKPLPEATESGLRDLHEIDQLIQASGYAERIKIDPSVVRGLEYYTGPVFEVELLIETKDDKGRPVRFGSVGGGGRYDGLVSRFTGQPVPATGFSIGVSRLMAALTTIGQLSGKPPVGPVLVAVFGADSVQNCQTLAAALRNAGIRAEMYLGNPKHGIGQQLKYADKRGSPCAVIQGPDEKAKGEVLIRDLIAGSAPSDIKVRDEYLKKQAKAQFAVKESELVEKVRELLARHKLG
jgi:histidyl-tRNA synthetase